MQLIKSGQRRRNDNAERSTLPSAVPVSPVCLLVAAPDAFI
jgi:hypothetical protein